MSRAQRKLNRYVRTMKERLARFEVGVVEDISTERGRCLAIIRRETHPGLLTRLWRWLA